MEKPLTEKPLTEKPVSRAELMMGQFKKATSNPNPYVKYAMSKNDINTWYVLLGNFAGNSDEFAGGEYLVRLHATDRFPFKAPHFYFMTENGVYSVGKKVCIHIGEFHDGSYPATFGLSQFAMELANGMIGWKDLGNGIALLKTSVGEKKRLAALSKQTNEQHARIINHVNETYEMYSKKWAEIVPEVAEKSVDMSMFSN